MLNLSVMESDYVFLYLNMIIIFLFYRVGDGFNKNIREEKIGKLRYIFRVYICNCFSLR